MNKQQLQDVQYFLHRFKTETPLYTIREDALMPYKYSTVLLDFIEYIHHQNLIPYDYLSIGRRWSMAADKKQFIQNIDQEDCEKLLGAFVRQDRFTDGLLVKEIENGNFEAVLERLHELISIQ